MHFQKAGWRRFAAAPAMALVTMLVACANMPAAEIGVVDFNADELTYTWGNVDVNVVVRSFRISTFDAEAPSGMPPIESLTVEVWDDANGNGEPDPGEAGETFAYQGSSHNVSMSNLEGSLGGNPERPRYRVVIKTAGGGGITHGGPISS